ncbi:MAG TPA: histidine kinase [Terracidiphilus sp.]|nr:histidine kinase [Terracidiphilus sp.]
MRNRRWMMAGGAVLFAACMALALRAYLHGPGRGLPYHDSFAEGEADEWKALGGTWELSDGMMRNDSDERGAKLLMGSPYWRNYSIEADVQLLGVSGDAGLILRSSNEEEGVNAYTGYYAGVRTLDNSLVLGRAQHSWMEFSRRSQVPGGIRPFQWYHLKLLAYGCEIAVSVSTPGSAGETAYGVTDSDCIRAGRAGLRSYSSGGIWRNVVVRQATQRDLEAMLTSNNPAGSMPQSSPVTTDTEMMHANRVLEQEHTAAGSTAAAQTIASLRLTSFVVPAHVLVRGVVALTVPRLYVQDSTGGLYVKAVQTPPLKVGDEVEVTGDAHPGSFSSTLDHATIRVLWANTPVPPVSVTASQAATGRYDATFVEVRGRLTAKERGANNSLVLDLDEGAQAFRAILNPGRSDALLARLRPGSSLRLRGVCVTDPALTGSITPFVLLLRSNEDLDVIAGPPWWNTGHIIEIVVATLVLALIAVFLYHRVENWRLRAIMEERELLAHEIHDTLAQSFAGIGFQLQAIRNGLSGNSGNVCQQLDLASSLVRHSHEEARRSIATLRMEELETEDLLAALEHCATRMVEGGEVRVVCEKEGDQRPVPLRIVDTLYRIGLEAIANAIRHAEPSLLTIRVVYHETEIALEIADDGRGLVQTASPLGFGIRGMRRRAQNISASLQIESAPGKGTRVRVEAALPPRTTWFNWPRYAGNYIWEHWIHARTTAKTHSTFYR